MNGGDRFEDHFWRSVVQHDRELSVLGSHAIADAEFRLLADHVPVPCWMAHGDGYIVWYNRRWHEYCGTTPAEMEGWGWRKVHDPAILPEVEARWTAALASGVPFEMTFPLRGADGVLRPFLTRIQPMRDHTGRIARWFGCNTNISAQADAEQELRHLAQTLEHRVEEAVRAREEALDQLRQAQKMEAVGQLTGGIAHDFNNMLAVVIGSLDLLERRAEGLDARALRYVGSAAEAARRAAALTQRLLAFSRQQPLRPEVVDANKLVGGMSDLLRRSLGEMVRLETVLAGGLWRIHVDPPQLEGALINLAVNARDAMPQGGRVTIETQNTHLDERYAAQHLGVPAGQYVLIAVSDTGAGMAAEVIAKAFDPFFTTKAVGKGTGLGLSQVYGFVKQSGGHVKIYSEPGQGTAIKLYLPRYRGEESDAEPAGGQVVPEGDSREVVLVVEDEPSVRQFSVDALGELGYAVLEADGGEAALRLLDGHPEISLLFTDVVMPGMNGAELAAEARRRRPDLKVLFTTGYTRNAVVHNGVLDPGVALLGKPYTIEALAAKVREVLDS